MSVFRSAHVPALIVAVILCLAFACWSSVRADAWSLLTFAEVFEVHAAEPEGARPDFDPPAQLIERTTPTLRGPIGLPSHGSDSIDDVPRTSEAAGAQDSNTALDAAAENGVPVPRAGDARPAHDGDG